MSKLTDRISYLKGMAAGMKLNMEKDSNKLLMEVLSALGDVAEEMAAMEDAHNDLNEYVESIDDDLAELEEVLYGDGEDEDEDGECDCEEEELPEGSMIVYECPHCAHEIELDGEDVELDEDALCPNCHQPIFPVVEEDDE